MRGTHIEYTRWVTDARAVADCPLSLPFTSLGSLNSTRHFFAPPKTPEGIVAECGGSKTYAGGFSASAPFPNPMGQGREARGRLRNLPSDFTERRKGDFRDTREGKEAKEGKECRMSKLIAWLPAQEPDLRQL